VSKRYGVFTPTLRDQLRQLGNNEPVWDGDLISKRDRDTLVDWGLATHDGDGMNRLTDSGRQVYRVLMESDADPHEMGR